jgi:CRISPR-associated protein Cmr3
MSDLRLRLYGRDALLFRDGRPFAAELGALHARTLPLPLPSALAGSLRTILGNCRRWNWNDDGPAQARSIPVRGPLLVREEEGKRVTLFPAPADALVGRSEPHAAPVRWPLAPCPLPDGSGCDLPEGLLPLDVPAKGKPEPGYRYWEWADLERWLCEPREGPAPEKIAGPELEDRLHVAIDAETGASMEGQLFGTTSLSLGEQWSLAAAVSGADAGELTGIFPFSGERRLARIVPGEEGDFPAPGDDLAARLRDAGGVRLVLATPAPFRMGWRPGWVGARLEGAPPAEEGDPLPVRLKLVAAAVPRRQPVSGWSLDRKQWGPKPVRWMAPAGSVYWFRVLEGDPGVLIEQAWLRPVTDEPQDRRDGFGLALWGAWDPRRLEAT